ncbi:MAG: class I SAM-dependent RNA methyltransferase [Oscillospiraceae bacterium]|jgi:putative N6-adenine-specific DNA methylase|nr:class I SAM-dependent RNA methyltransferase [Oscillospiraceae bacterium]
MFTYVVPCLLGMEGLIAEELRGMEARDVRAENGRVLFGGDVSILARANICSRFAERIQILVGEFPARSFDELFEGTKALPWEDWIGRRNAFPVKGYSIDSALFSVRDCQAIVKKAVVERLKGRHGMDWFEETGPLHQIQFALFKDRASLLLDTSGTGLHKRGYRPAAREAPLKETLAAALCRLARLQPNHTLYDPMCGSGTIVIEGALMAANIAPGLHRPFAAERWDGIDRRVWREERERAAGLARPAEGFQAVASDIDGEALAVARENAARAGVTKYIQFGQADVRNFRLQGERGTVITNPPYGERLLDLAQADELTAVLGRVFQPGRGRSYTILSSSEEFERIFGRRASKRRKLYNGMIKCQAYLYYD